MNKDQFLNKLYLLLKDLDEATRKNILIEYEIMINERLAKGEKEKTIISELKSPEEIASENGVFVKSNSSNSSSIVKSFFAGITLFFLNTIIVIPPLVLIIGLLLGLLGVSLGFLVGGFFGFIGILFAPLFPVFLEIHQNSLVVLSNSLFRYGVSLLLLGLSSTGAVFLILFGKASELFFRFIKNYIAWNINIIKR